MIFLFSNQHTPTRSGVFLVTFFLLTTIVGAIPSVTYAAIRETINYQGKIVKNDGIPPANGTYSMSFKIYNALTAGTLLWTENWNNTNQGAGASFVTVTEGNFSVELGTLCGSAGWTGGTCATNGGVDFSESNYFLEVAFDADGNGTYEETFLPRKPLTAVPYAFHARYADELAPDSNAFIQGGSTFGEDAILGTNDNHGVKLRANGANILYLDASGTVGIGAVPTGTYLLQVNGSVSFDGGAILSNGSGQLTAGGVLVTSVPSGSLNPSAALQVDSTTAGVLVPRMTTTARDAISAPATGLLVYNTIVNRHQVYNGAAWSSFVTMDSSNNLVLNGTSAGTSAAGVLAITDSTAPTASITNGVQLFAVDQSGAHELRVRDEAGNVTTLSPHNFSALPEGPSEEMAWSYYSERDGQAINVDMLRAMRVIEELSGEPLVVKKDLATGVVTVRDLEGLTTSQPDGQTRLIKKLKEETGVDEVGSLGDHTGLIGNAFALTDIQNASVASHMVIMQKDGVVLGDAFFGKKAYFSQDQAGAVIVKGGETRVTVVFSTPYLIAPVIVATPMTFEVGKYMIEDPQPEKFTIRIENPVATNVQFNWVAIAVNPSFHELPTGESPGAITQSESAATQTQANDGSSGNSSDPNALHNTENGNGNTESGDNGNNGGGNGNGNGNGNDNENTNGNGNGGNNESENSSDTQGTESGAGDTGTSETSSEGVVPPADAPVVEDSVPPAEVPTAD